GSALLLERIAPGSALTERVTAGDDDGATVVLCGVMERLHAAGPPMKSFATVEQWGESFARLPRDTGALPADLLDRAASLYGELWRSQGPRVLLHGDLHHDNVLDGGLRGWLAIDPKGIIGERAYETGALLRNPTEDASRFARPEVIDRRVRILCE